MPQVKDGDHRLPESLANVPKPPRLPIVIVDVAHLSKRVEPTTDVLGRPPADRTKERL